MHKSGDEKGGNWYDSTKKFISFREYDDKLPLATDFIFIIHIYER